MFDLEYFKNQFYDINQALTECASNRNATKPNLGELALQLYGFRGDVQALSSFITESKQSGEFPYLIGRSTGRSIQEAASLGLSDQFHTLDQAIQSIHSKAKAAREADVKEQQALAVQRQAAVEAAQKAAEEQEKLKAQQTAAAQQRAASIRGTIAREPEQTSSPQKSTDQTALEASIARSFETVRNAKQSVYRAIDNHPRFGKQGPLRDEINAQVDKAFSDLEQGLEACWDGLAVSSAESGEKRNQFWTRVVDDWTHDVNNFYHKMSAIHGDPAIQRPVAILLGVLTVGLVGAAIAGSVVFAPMLAPALAHLWAAGGITISSGVATGLASTAIAAPLLAGVGVSGFFAHRNYTEQPFNQQIENASKAVQQRVSDEFGETLKCS